MNSSATSNAWRIKVVSCFVIGDVFFTLLCFSLCHWSFCFVSPFINTISQPELQQNVKKLSFNLSLTLVVAVHWYYNFKNIVLYHPVTHGCLASMGRCPFDCLLFIYYQCSVIVLCFCSGDCLDWYFIKACSLKSTCNEWVYTRDEKLEILINYSDKAVSKNDWTVLTTQTEVMNQRSVTLQKHNTF